MEKKGKPLLTNEKLVKKFKSSFELVNYAIKLAENMIGTGRDSRVKSEVQSRAMLILEEISEGKDHFDEIISTTSSDKDSEEMIPQQVIHEEKLEKRKTRHTEILEPAE